MDMDLYYLRRSLILLLQWILFFVLTMIGLIIGATFIPGDKCISAEYYCYPHARLTRLEKALITDCFNLADPTCSRQIYISNHYFKVRLLLIYFSSVFIMMIYTWHRTVRLKSCFFAVSVITVLIFGIDFVLYFNQPACVVISVFFMLIFWYPLLIAFLSNNNENPLSLLCGIDVPLDNLDEFLQNSLSKRARFYRWAKHMKKKWNIKEEKLIISIISIIILSTVFIIISAYTMPFIFEYKRDMMKTCNRYRDVEKLCT